MDLFEILFVVLFILFPIMEQVLKRNRSPGPPGDEETPEQEAGAPPRRESGKASDMVPDDLWAVLTGEQRPAAGREPVGFGDEPGVEGAAQESGEEWRGEEEWASEEPQWSPAPAREQERRRGSSAPWSIDDDEVLEQPVPAPVSLEQYGPEAYSLERLDQEPVSLEQPVPSEEVRHRQFHALIDRPSRPRRMRRSSLGRALRSPGSLRQAFVLSEVLGPPKALHD